MTILTLKWTIDAAGNWQRVPMLLTKTERGWKETAIQSQAQVQP